MLPFTIHDRQPTRCVDGGYILICLPHEHRRQHPFLFFIDAFVVLAFVALFLARRFQTDPAHSIHRLLHALVQPLVAVGIIFFIVHFIIRSHFLPLLRARVQFRSSFILRASPALVRPARPSSAREIRVIEHSREPRVDLHRARLLRHRHEPRIAVHGAETGVRDDVILIQRAAAATKLWFLRLGRFLRRIVVVARHGARADARKAFFRFASSRRVAAARVRSRCRARERVLMCWAVVRATNGLDLATAREGKIEPFCGRKTARGRSARSPWARPGSERRRWRRSRRRARNGEANAWTRRRRRRAGDEGRR